MGELMQWLGWELVDNLQLVSISSVRSINLLCCKKNHVQVEV